MTLTTTEYKYVQIDERNMAIIAGTRMKVVELVTSIKAYGWSPEELAFQYPHLTMSQIHSALAYYWDHFEAINADIEQRFQAAEALRLEAGESQECSQDAGTGSTEMSLALYMDEQVPRQITAGLPHIFAFVIENNSLSVAVG